MRKLHVSAATEGQALRQNSNNAFLLKTAGDEVGIAHSVNLIISGTFFGGWHGGASRNNNK